jgi:FAD/FMN-containing dehydrogenase/Fe-S oxidoreductase
MNLFLEQQRHDLARHLRRHLAGEVRFDIASRKLYATDASIYQIEPIGVVIPRTVEDIVATVQVAGAMRVPITSRGGGTSLSGQAVGAGIVLDCSKYLRQILDIDPANRTARVQPGVVLDTFNEALAAHDLFFGPDVSTSSRANLGGMIGNNSAGSRSIVYGKTIDHVRRLDVVLADGSRAVLEKLTPPQWSAREKSRTPDAALYAGVGAIVRRHRDEIHRRFPRIMRRVSGYNLDALVGLADGEPAGLHDLLVGSEGTLGITTEAEVGLVVKPKVRGLLVPQFASLADAMNALAPCLEMQPSAVELMDHLLLELTAGNLALRDATRFIDPRTRAIFMVEFSGDDAGEVADRVEKLKRRLASVGGLIDSTLALDPAIRDPLWNLRRASMPLLYGMPGDRKPITFVEDTAVSPEQLPEFVAAFRDLLRRHGTDGAFYGHASVGCLHIRPVMNLKDQSDVALMRRITEEVTDLVLVHGGSLSGEHGDGLARSEWNRKMFGDDIYEAFCQIKHIFDPNGILNPGKIVHAAPMTENLRYPPDYRPAEPPTVFDYSKQQGFLRSVEMCNGNGACRKTSGGTMCPSYRATLDERDNTRGRANALRHALAGAEPGEGVPETLRQRWVHEVFDLCLSCKACKTECPSGVDVAKLKAEFTQFYYAKRPRPLGHLLVAGLPYFNRLAAPFAPLVNAVQESRLSRWLLHEFAGIDRRRSLPPLSRDHFRRWFRRHPADPLAGRNGKVLLLADCFTTYSEPHIGRAAVRVLERAGYAVEIADAFCCGRTLLSKGFLHRAKAWTQSQLPRLARSVADGTPILGLEPSCILSLADEWPELCSGEPARAVAASAHMADRWLAEQIASGRASLPLLPGVAEAVVHGHCHQKALLGNASAATAARLVPGLDVKLLDVGCCGMAGSFGFEAAHYDISVQIANLALLPALAKAEKAEVIAAGTSCRHQIHDLTGRRAVHPMELLAGRLPAG